MMLQVDPALRARLPELRLGAVSATCPPIREQDPALTAELQALAATLAATWAGQRAADRREIALTRQAYRTLGDDPTHYRPSNEALLRRVLSAKPLPQINVAVDSNTLVSLDSGWPLGCYNLAAIDGPITVRQGYPGEQYGPIGKPAVAATGRLVLADDRGIFGSPTADAQRTQVLPGMTELLFVVFAFDGALPVAAIEQSERLLRQYCHALTTPVGTE